jgi:hypothetical protein
VKEKYIVVDQNFDIFFLKLFFLLASIVVSLVKTLRAQALKLSRPCLEQ